MPSRDHASTQVYEDHPDAFMVRLDICWSSLVGKAADLELRGDTTASLRALLLAAAVADGALPSIAEAHAALTRRCSSH